MDILIPNWNPSTGKPTGLNLVIDASFAPDQIADAFVFQQSGRRFGKIVLEFGAIQEDGAAVPPTIPDIRRHHAGTVRAAPRL